MVVTKGVCRRAGGSGDEGEQEESKDQAEGRAGASTQLHTGLIHIFSHDICTCANGSGLYPSPPLHAQHLFVLAEEMTVLRRVPPALQRAVKPYIRERAPKPQNILLHLAAQPGFLMTPALFLYI